MFVYKSLILIIYKFNSKIKIENAVIEYVEISLIINTIFLLFIAILHYYVNLHEHILRYIFFGFLLKNCIITYLYKTIKHEVMLK